LASNLLELDSLTHLVASHLFALTFDPFLVQFFCITPSIYEYLLEEEFNNGDDEDEYIVNEDEIDFEQLDKPEEEE